MNKYKILGLALTMTLSSYSFAQNNNKEGEIVMTQSELDSFLEMVAKKRIEQLKKTQNNSNGQVMTMTYVPTEVAEDKDQQPKEYSGNASQREIDRLYDRVNQLADWVYWGRNGGNVPPQTAPVAVAPNSVKPKKACCKMKNAKAQDSKDDRIVALEQQLAELKGSFNVAEETETVTITPERRSFLEDLLAKYKNFKEQVFFANNSVAVDKKYNKYINDVVTVLKQNPELAVVLKGYASPTGSVEYNKQLSMRRSEAIGDVLVSKGISKNRIIEGFYGEDHSTTEAGARRVDMTVVIK